MSRPAVGVIGTGAMGMGVVRSLLRHGYPVLARDIRPEAQAESASLGATAVASAAEAARGASIAIVLVVDAPQVDDVLFGADGAAAAFAPDAIVVLSSTVDPSYAAALAPRLAAHDVRLVDAPVSGGPAKAAAGTMTLMASGAPPTLARCAEVFAAIAGRVFEVGERPGEAAAIKIVNNLLAAANLAAAAEALDLARRAGLDARLVLDVVGASSGASWILADRGPRALAGDFAPRAAAKILAKDVGIAVDFAHRHGGAARFASAALEAFRAAVEAGHGELDDAVLLGRPDGDR